MYKQPRRLDADRGFILPPCSLPAHARQKAIKETTLITLGLIGTYIILYRRCFRDMTNGFQQCPSASAWRSHVSSGLAGRRTQPCVEEHRVLTGEPTFQVSCACTNMNISWLSWRSSTRSRRKDSYPLPCLQVGLHHLSSPADLHAHKHMRSQKEQIFPAYLTMQILRHHRGK